MVLDISERKKAEEELRLQSVIMTNLSEGVHLIRMDDGIIVYTNPRFEEMFGYDPGELIGKHISVVNTPTDKNPEEIVKEVMEILEGTEEWHGEVNNIKKDGIPFWCYANVSTFNHPDYGKVAVTTQADITERKKAEEKLKESEEKFRTFAEQSFTGISIVQDDLFKYVNRTLAEIFGYKSDELLNLQQADFIKLVHPEDRDLVSDQISKRQLGDLDVINNYQFRGIRKNGDIIWLDIFGKTINYEGRPASYGIIMDITEKKKIEEIKSKLLTRFSHEFKTPLVSINGYIDLLINEYRESFDSETMSILKEAKQGSTRLKQLINLFIESSKLEEKMVKVNLVEDNLYDLITVCLNELEGLIRLRAHTINIDLQEDLIIMFDREKLKEVISNLLVNSVKYTPPGGNIEIKSRIEDNFIVISIKDYGIGLTEDEKLQLFTQFGKIERYGQGWNILSEGSGMGLYISKELIELHGGKIWAESEGRNQGSTFNFSLPLKR